MKKQRDKQRRFQKWKSAYVMRLRSASKPANKQFAPRRRSKRDANQVLIAPRHFVILSANRHQKGTDVNEYFEFLAELRGVKSSPLKIDMSEVRRMVANAALLFKAELSRLVQLRQTHISAIAPKSLRTKQVLRQTGIDRLLNLNIEEEPDREDVVHWRIAEGGGYLDQEPSLAPIFADIEKVTGLAVHPVYQGIMESIGNCIEHAYKSHPDVTWQMPADPNWWVFQQVKDEELNVVVCDLGIGVSKALPLKLENEQGLLKKLMHIVRRTKGMDNRALLAAMEYGRSSTNEAKRGKGMTDAHAVINNHGEGNFYAMSNRGYYMYRKTSKSTAGQHKTVRFKHSINGTILGWRLPLVLASQQGT